MAGLLEEMPSYILSRAEASEVLFGASTCQKPFLVVSRPVLHHPYGKGSELGLRQPPTLRPITRLKLLKRQMDGRARFDLLRSRVPRRA